MADSDNPLLLSLFVFFFFTEFTVETPLASLDDTGAGAGVVVVVRVSGFAAWKKNFV
jgi:hypothetical protein